ncbi:MAG TPA: secondary thiamine-phosphate synthase enzyme YjbQ [Bacteroidia bacterium]|nr:secondary thiamine-phosphate synthase enzyme YjbQ [Bacteroidia bacterium]HRS58485.1 secondary thiamine-phosphate synthase enzyme YjbQ [Bacteroidia bacterium]HRU68384.1 secondary thiamine-phosphate synthase enzyme YjbQ [Bacteroidia bacterium]
MIIQKEIKIQPKGKGFHLITKEVLQALGELPEKGLLNLFICHTSAGLSINENSDSSVLHDMDKSFDLLARENETFYTHTMEGRDDMPAHVKSTLTGVSLTIPITGYRLALGTWQGIYLCEFRYGGRTRTIIATLYT